MRKRTSAERRDRRTRTSPRRVGRPNFARRAFLEPAARDFLFGCEPEARGLLARLKTLGGHRSTWSNSRKGPS